MNKLFDNLSADMRDQLEERDPPEWIEPMLATLADEPFSDDEWIFERKLDGERCLAFRDGDEVRLLTRNQKSLNTTYPELADAVASQSVDRLILDGEVVAFEGQRTSFARLQQRMQLEDPEEIRQSNVAVYLYFFDIPYLDGFDLTALPLRQRKSLLQRAIDYNDPLRFTPHRNKKGKAYFNEVCQKGWEGLIAKDAHSKYIQSRSRQWRKFKCVNQQEFVIGGYTDPQGERIGFGALLIGYYAGDDLTYAGKVGTGYDDETLQRMIKRLKRIERKTTPFVQDDDLPSKHIHWVTPELVGEVKFTEWTQDDKLRHPSFLGLRRDKDPQDVVREEPS